MVIKNLRFLKESNNKKTLIGAGVGVVILLAIGYLLVTPSNQAGEQVSKAFEESAEQNNTYMAPPPLDTPATNGENMLDTKALESIKNGSFAEPQDEVKSEIESKVADISGEADPMLLQKEAMEKIERMQKPKDMVVFLNSIKSKIELYGYKNFFKYEMMNYKVGDIFLDFYKVEEINSNFIRFADKHYSYNLRFIEE